MAVIEKRLSRTFKRFVASEKAGGILLIVGTVISLILANSLVGEDYLRLWQVPVAGLRIEHWINDALMAIFFLLIGLELERELYNGELSNVRNALLPICAAAGGIAVPALIHFAFNGGLPTQAGVGIPMATDIAFALGVLALLGSRVPASLKIFLTALAVMDDLGAIIVIAVFYTAELAFAYLLGALAVFGVLVCMNRMLRVQSLALYLAGGAIMWVLMLKSGVHATIAGVLLAFAIPYSAKQDDEASPSHRLEHFLHKPVAFVILPIFALANTGIVIGPDWAGDLASPNSIGILAGLVLGKPLGIVLLSFLAVAAGLCRLPLDLRWRHVVGAGLLGGIGFTMSIFITNLAFAGEADTINASKMAILLASCAAGLAGFAWLKAFGKPVAFDRDMETMDFESDQALSAAGRGRRAAGP
ncbi:MAG TPA: Na+/H+ antiporter NhaA [Noviherbaspirillum sp.]|jgi:NhaA family Na+:H+ antiporter|uniref:Na+/H+ antiporter NhaA n=1 Tax=Noviherbaspirillum sp. TaxID=1926288 RepID=UPI002F927FEE